MERAIVRTWAGRAVALGASLALVTGASVSAGDRTGAPLRKKPFEPVSVGLDWVTSGETGGGGREPTGGAVFFEMLGGDATAFAGAMGFQVRELASGRKVADPTPETNVFDAVYFCQIVNGEDPGSGAEPDFFLRAPEGSQSNGFVLGSSFGRTQFEHQPALTAIRTSTAHRYSTGGGIVVAVLDTGIDAAHSAFEGHVLPGHDFVDDDADASEGLADGIDQDGDGEADDGIGHGTMVAGLVLGAAPDARILPVRVLDEEARGTASSLSAGIRYAVDQGATVINLSLGALGRSSAVEEELMRAFEARVIVVAAAGNTRGSAPVEFPANVDGVIAATGIGGTQGDIWAPAVNVAGPYPGERWFRGKGTSFAAALVSGGVALARRTDASVTPWEIVYALPPYRRHTFRLDLPRLAR